jgi:DNA polymerase I-like protein with 3'-5' exonuclease and polymerase domains
MIEFDVETTGFQPHSGHEAFLWIFMGASAEDAEAIEFRPSDPDPEAQARIQWWFDRAKADEDGIRAWNAKFDRAFAETAGCFDVPGDGKWHDGMLVAHAMDERRSVALKAVASQLFGEEAADPQKRLKAWLNDENKRRRKVVDDAGKIDGAIQAAEANAEKWDLKAQSAKKVETQEKYRAKARTFEAQARDLTARAADLKAEAKTYYREDGTFVYADYSDVPMDIMEPYALEDVILTRKVSDVYDAALENKPDLRRVYEFEREAMDAIYAIEKRGLPARAEEYRKLEQEVIANLDVLEDKVMDLAAEADPAVYAKALGKKVEVSEDGRIVSVENGGSLSEFNPNSSAHILAALKARGADMSYMSEKDGKLNADADNLRAVDDALAAAILEFRSEFKVLTTYVRPMIGRSYVSQMNVYKEPFIAPDSRIHATYRQVGARTGRMSCADPNMQNQPRDDLRLRYNIVAEPGNVLVTADLSNIEMVLFAAYCGEGRLLDAVRKGEDLHVLTARMLGLRDRARPGGGVETARQLGKTYNFSRIYGGGLRTIKRSFRCSMDEARLLKKRFDDAYPEVGRLQNRIEYRLQDDGYIQDKLISGRRFRVDVREAYKATNYLVQGTAASLLKYAVVQLHKDGVPMVALVHDEIVAHVPRSDAQEVADLLVKRMTEFEGLQGVVPLNAEADIVERWSDAKPLKEKLLGPDGEPLLADNGEPLVREYLFTPQWAGGEKRYLEAA